ncbi:MAG: hypothetical protein AAF081_20115, partial [Actinomycetota bacterium]
AGLVVVEDLSVPADDPNLNFLLGLGDGQDQTVRVASGLSIADIDAAVIAAAQGDNTTLAASPIGRTELQNSPLASLTFGQTPIPEAIRNNPDLARLPLIDIELNQPGGWTAILEGTVFADRPLVDVTLGEVLAASSPVAATIVALPLTSLDVNGTSLASLPLTSLVLGNTPLTSLPLTSLGFDVCAELAPFFPELTCTEI